MIDAYDGNTSLSDCRLFPHSSVSNIVIDPVHLFCMFAVLKSQRVKLRFVDSSFCCQSIAGIKFALRQHERASCCGGVRISDSVLSRPGRRPERGHQRRSNRSKTNENEW